MKRKVHKTLICIMIVLLIGLTGCGKSERIIESFEDAREARIGVMTGSTGERLAMEKFPQADIKSFDDVMDAVTALQVGQIDAIITAYPTALNAAKHNPELWYLPEPVDYEDTAIGIKKGNEELLTQVNAILRSLKNDGTLEDMKRRWFKTELGPYEEVRIPLPEDGEALKVGVSATREPFSFVDDKQRVTGHDGELAHRIAAKLNRPLQFSDMTFSALIPALQSGKVDMVITGMTATEERRKTVDFSQPYFANAQVLLVKKAAAAGEGQQKMALLEDIADKRVGVYEGTIHDAFVETTYPQAEVMRFNSTADMVLALKNNKVDVILFDAVPSGVILKNNQDLGVLTDEVLSTPLGIGFSKNNPQLRKKFNEFLQVIREDGTYQEMYSRWIENDPEKAVMPALENHPQGSKVILGVAVGDLPYVAMKDGEYTGFDIEMLRRFAQYEGFNLEIVPMEFSALVAALSSGKVDMIADSISITEERQKAVDFSQPYMDSKTAAIALKSNLAEYAGEEAAPGKNPFWKSFTQGFYNNLVLENRYRLILDGLKVTVIISLFSLLFGTLLGGLVCFLRMSKRKVLNLIARAYISLLRGTPVLVLLMLIFYVVFASVDINPVFVAVVAFGMNFAAYVAEMYRTGIEGVDKGQREAGIAMGFTKAETFFYIVLPQAVMRILPVYKGEFISMVKMTSVVGYIAVQDLTKAGDIIRGRTYEAFFPLIMVAVIYFVISWLLMLALGHVERFTDPKFKKRQVKKAI